MQKLTDVHKKHVNIPEMHTAPTGGFTRKGTYEKTCHSNVFEIVPSGGCVKTTPIRQRSLGYIFVDSQKCSPEHVSNEKTLLDLRHF